MSSKTNGRGVLGMGTRGGGRTESITHTIPKVHGAGAAVGLVWQGRESGWGQGWFQPGGQEEGARVPPALYVTAVTSGLVPSCWSLSCSSCGGSFRANSF